MKQINTSSYPIRSAWLVEGQSNSFFPRSPWYWMWCHRTDSNVYAWKYNESTLLLVHMIPCCSVVLQEPLLLHRSSNMQHICPIGLQLNLTTWYSVDLYSWLRKQTNELTLHFSFYNIPLSQYNYRNWGNSFTQQKSTPKQQLKSKHLFG